MCGIAGLIDFTRTSDRATLTAIVTAMTDTLIRRGPDGGGVWGDETAGIGLGHRRLAILDLTPEGHQPMVSADGRWVLVFNGEIYNFRALRGEMESLGHRFRGHSDTEVMLAAFRQWGPQAAVQRLVGMFAFALWDRQEQVLVLGRDRLGEKPLYYGWLKGSFVFASELKALVRHPAWQGAIDRQSLALLLRYGYIPAPHCIYQGIHKLPPATLLTLTLGNPGSATPQPYWSLQSVAEQGLAQPFQGSDREAITHLDTLLKTAVQHQMIADVPLGAFLSGGVDSSTIVALMQAQSSQPIKTFTMGFSEPTYNEAPYARAIAHHLGTDHQELYVTPEEAMAVIGQLPDLYDEPFADSSQIPTFLVSQLARSQVTVSLSGDGGDELFFGYPRYRILRDLWRWMGWMPVGSRRALGKGLGAIAPWLEHQDWVGAALGPYRPQRALSEQVQKLAEALSFPTPEAMYLRLVSAWQQPETVVQGGTGLPSLFAKSLDPGIDVGHQMMYWDLQSYLPGDILTKVDRATMGVSLESRMPFLDHRVVEFCWQLSLTHKTRQGLSKWLLRQVLYQYVPPALIERPKMGFGLPIAHWLRGPLKAWAEDLLAPDRLQRQGFFEAAPIQRKWQEHLRGDRNWQYPLWTVLMAQLWLGDR